MNIIDLVEKKLKLAFIDKVIGNHAICSLIDIEDNYKSAVFVSLTDYSNKTFLTLENTFTLSSGISNNKIYFGTFDISTKIIKIFEANTVAFSERLIASIPFNDHKGIFEGEDAIDSLRMFIHNINQSLLLIGYSEFDEDVYEKTLLLDLNTLKIKDISNNFRKFTEIRNITPGYLGLLDYKSDHVFIHTGGIGYLEKLENYNENESRNRFETLSYIEKRQFTDISKAKADEIMPVEIEKVDYNGNIQFIGNINNDVYYELFDLENESSIINKFNATENKKVTLKDKAMDMYGIFEDILYGIEYDNYAKEARIYDLTNGYKNSCHVISYVDNKPFIYYISSDEILYCQKEASDTYSEITDTTYYIKGNKTQRFDNRRCYYDEVNSQILLY